MYVHIKLRNSLKQRKHIGAHSEIIYVLEIISSYKFDIPNTIFNLTLFSVYGNCHLTGERAFHFIMIFSNLSMTTFISIQFQSSNKAQSTVYRLFTPFSYTLYIFIFHETFKFYHKLTNRTNFWYNWNARCINSFRLGVYYTLICYFEI